MLKECLLIFPGDANMKRVQRSDGKIDSKGAACTLHPNWQQAREFLKVQINTKQVIKCDPTPCKLFSVMSALATP